MKSDLFDYFRLHSPHFNHIQRGILNRAQKLNVPVIKPETALQLISLLQLIRPRRVVELGSGLGYSAYIFAKYGGAELKEVISVDISKPAQERAAEMIAIDPVSERISWVHMDGAIYLEEQKLDEIDFFFIDALKDAYETYFNLIQRQKARRGRYTIVFDNLFLNGDTINQGSGKGVRMHRLIRKLLHTYPDYFTLLPVGDGIGIFSGE